MKFSTSIGNDLYRISFPYKEIFTTVVIAKTPQGFLMYDAASYPEDMDNILFPALEELGVTGENLKYVAISHSHGDHAGGLGRFLEKFGSVPVISSNQALREKHPGADFVSFSHGEVLLGCLKVLSIPGHTSDAFALLDTRSGILLSSDCLQFYGIFGSGKWGSNISFPTDHLKALENLEKEEIRAIFGAHDFHPCGQFVEGKEEVKKALFLCREPLNLIRAYLGENLLLSDEEVAEKYNGESSLPTVGAHVFRKMRKEFFS